MPDGIDENFTIRLLAHLVNAEMTSSFVGHHIVATSSCAQASSRPKPGGSSGSERLDAAEHSSMLIM
jgi:hypothetical protein